jgi:phosphohistidine swiveling domain-containing protein
MKQIVNFWDKDLVPDKDLLGGKGASLVLMTQLAMPVPPGFILTTEAWRHYDESGRLADELLKELKLHLAELEKLARATFGSVTAPLLVSVRSGARYSMPGMMDTIPNVGINREILAGLTKRLGSEVSVWDTYRRFLRMFASSVYGIHAGEFDLLNGEGEQSVEKLQGVVDAYEKLVFLRVGKKVPEDPLIQLTQSVEAIFRSWYNPGAVAYRQLNGIPDQLGTAANIQMMVYGNKPNSGTGVLFTRDTTTGENRVIGDYLTNAQGEDIVRGSVARKTISIEQFATDKPLLAQQLFAFAKKLESVQKDAQDMEFTIEDNELWLLQTRSAKRTPLANIRITKELYEEGVLSESQALKRIKPSDVEHVQLPTFEKDEEAEARGNLLSTGITASPGVAVGHLAITPAGVAQLKAQGQQPVFVCDHIDPNDIATLLQVSAVATTKGSASSHMALIMRSAGIPGVVGASAIKVDNEKLKISAGNKQISVGGEISVDATKGLIYARAIGIASLPAVPADIIQLIEKRNHLYTRSPWSAGIYEDPGSPAIPDLVKKVREIRIKAATQWQSEKARVVEALNGFFDDQTMIKFVPVRPDDRAGLEKTLLDVLHSGHFNGPRTCHFPVKLAGAPWCDGPNSPAEIKDFLTNPDFPGKYGGFPRWIADPTLDAILVAYEKEGKLRPELADQHFVCTLSCVNGLTSQLIINVLFKTAQLRALERVQSSELAMIKINLDPEQRYAIGDKTYQLGRSYLDDQLISVLAKSISGDRTEGSEESLLRTKRHLLKQLASNYPGIRPEKIGQEELKDLVFDLMNRNMLPADVFRWVVNKQTLSLLDQISKVILEKWWRAPIYLPHIMSALDEVSGLSVLEAQGRFNGDKILWFKIYGAKGSEERDKIKNWKGQ